MSTPRLLGAVLAGGESRRFGRDKAATLLAGLSLVERAATTLSRVFDDVVIVSSREPVTTAWPQVPDRHPGLGPLAGVEAALLAARERGCDGAFVLACDMPLVDEATVRAVVAALGDAMVAAPSSREGGDIEPLCAVYRLDCLPEVVRALERRALAAHALFASVGGRRVTLPRELFLNVNTPEDHAHASVVLERERR
jgi:molybdopterin-guanine dinucleotide biosynthesis protein A